MAVVPYYASADMRSDELTVRAQVGVIDYEIKLSGEVMREVLDFARVRRRAGPKNIPPLVPAKLPAGDAADE